MVLFPLTNFSPVSAYLFLHICFCICFCISVSVYLFLHVSFVLCSLPIGHPISVIICLSSSCDLLLEIHLSNPFLPHPTFLTPRTQTNPPTNPPPQRNPTPTPRPPRKTQIPSLEIPRKAPKTRNKVRRQSRTGGCIIGFSGF